jgi:inner membrane protease ATP23
MMKHLKANGCNVTPEHLVCLPCSQQQRSGGFIPAAGAVALCQDGFVHKAHMESTMVHELVHMYDQCKFKVDWNNLRHHACSEVC